MKGKYLAIAIYMRPEDLPARNEHLTRLDDHVRGTIRRGGSGNDQTPLGGVPGFAIITLWIPVVFTRTGRLRCNARNMNWGIARSAWIYVRPAPTLASIANSARAASFGSCAARKPKSGVRNGRASRRAGEQTRKVKELVVQELGYQLVFIRECPTGNGSSSPPLKKGDLGGFIRAYKIPPSPPFPKGGSFKEFPDEN
jgi:hypothetical protein